MMGCPSRRRLQWTGGWLWNRGGWRFPVIRTVCGRVLGEKGRGRGAAERGDAGRWSHSAGEQQGGGAVVEGFEEARHLLQLLTDGSDLT